MSIASISGGFSAQKSKSSQSSTSQPALMPQTSLDRWLQSIYQGEMLGGVNRDRYRNILAQKKNKEISLMVAKNKLAAAEKEGNARGVRFWKNIVRNRQNAFDIANEKAKIYEPEYKREAMERQAELDQARDAITQYLTENAELVPEAMREQAGIQSGTLDKLLRMGTSREGYLPNLAETIQNLTSGGPGISFGGQPVISNYMSPGRASALESILKANKEMPEILSGLAQQRSDINIAPARAQYQYGFAPLEERLGYAESPDATMQGGLLARLLQQMELPNLLRYLQGGIATKSKGKQSGVGWSSNAGVSFGGGSGKKESGGTGSATQLPTYNRQPLQIPQIANSNYNNNWYRE